MPKTANVICEGSLSTKRLPLHLEPDGLKRVLSAIFCIRKDLNIVPSLTGLIVGFLRDRTSLGTSQDNPGWDVQLSLCPRTKRSRCPFVPGQKSFLFVPGQDLQEKSRDVPKQNHYLIGNFLGYSESEKAVLKQERMF